MFNYPENILNTKPNEKITIDELCDLFDAVPGVVRQRSAQLITENKSGEIELISSVVYYNLPMFDMSVIVMSNQEYAGLINPIGKPKQSIKYFKEKQLNDVSLIDGGVRYIAQFETKEYCVEFYAFTDSLDKGFTFNITASDTGNRSMIIKQYPHLGRPVINDLILITREETEEMLGDERIYKYTILLAGSDLRNIIKNTLYLTNVLGESEVMRWKGCLASNFQSHINWLAEHTGILRGAGKFSKELL